MKKRFSSILTVLLALSLCAALLCTGTAAEESSVTADRDIVIYEKGEYLYGVPENWTVNILKTHYSGRAYTVFDPQGGTLLGSSAVYTGCKLRYEVGIGDVKEFTIVITGDVSGDGKVTATDYLKIRAFLRNKGSLDGVYWLAADINGDQTISTVDYLNIKAYFFGSYDIYNRVPIIPDSDDSSTFIESDDSWTSGWQ